MSTESNSARRQALIDPTLVQRLAVSDSGFIFDPVSGQSFSVNETGLRILRLLKEGQDLNAAVKTLCDEFLGTAADIERDVLEFAGLLRKQFPA